MTKPPGSLTGVRLASAVTAVLAWLCISCNLVVGDGDYIVLDDSSQSGATSDSSADAGPQARDASTTEGDSPRDAGAAAMDANADSEAAVLLGDASSSLANDAGTSDTAQPALGNDASADAPADRATDAPADASANADANRQPDAGQGTDARDAKPPCTVCIEVYQRQEMGPVPPRELVLPFQLRNTGTAPINLAAITLRYYFTADGCSLNTFGGRCDGAQLNNGPAPCPGARVFGLPTAKPTADAYIEISFPDIVLPPTVLPAYQASGASFPEAHECVFQLSNDHSFNASGSNFVLASNIAAYFNGVLVWGTEP